MIINPKNGRTPVKGVDYWTDTDKDDLIDSLLEEIPDNEVGGCRVNLLHNWYFANPVNQRGQTEYTGAGYTIDRWILNGGSMTIDGGVSWSEGYVLYQSFEYPLNDGRKRTFSYLDVNGNLASGELTTEYTEIGDYAVCHNNTAFLYILAKSNSPKIVAVKLELGDTQTLAHQDADGNWVLNEIPDYNEELLKCCMSKADSTDTYANNKKTASILGAIAENAELTTDCNIHLTTGGYKFLVAYYNTATLNSPYADPNCSSDDASGLVLTFTVSSTYGRQICLTGAGDGVFVRYNVGGTISPWVAFATTDYAVSKSGDTMTGALEIKSSGYANQLKINRLEETGDSVINFFHNSVPLGAIGFSGDSNKMIVRFGDTSIPTYDVLHTGNYNNYAVPNTGGTITGDLIISKSNQGGVFGLNASNKTAYVQYRADDRKAAANFVLSPTRCDYQVTADGTKWDNYNILHTGNSNQTALVATETTPTVNNQINWTYE